MINSIDKNSSSVVCKITKNETFPHLKINVNGRKVVMSIFLNQKLLRKWDLFLLLLDDLIHSYLLSAVWC